MKLGDKVGLKWPYDQDAIFEVIGIHTVSNTQEQLHEGRRYMTTTQEIQYALEYIEGPDHDLHFGAVISIDSSFVVELSGK